MSAKVPITVAHGDGIGPEIMPVVLGILESGGAKIAIETVTVGEALYKQGHRTGIAPDVWESLRRTRIFLKSPITTPQGGGYKSLNVTIRASLGLYANVRPCIAYHPFVRTRFPNVDLVIVRENQEDLYSGIEHRQTADVVQCLKLISRSGSERLIRYAFEYAKSHGRKKITCFTKDNIMKLSDGLFHRVFDEIAAEYPEIENEHWIVDIGTALVADSPENFDIIVVPNLYGDIISDVAAQVVGSVGLAGSANIGDACAMFEAIHGSAPRIAGQDTANPSGLLMGALMMLEHIGQSREAARIRNAWLKALEDGIHTADIYDPRTSKQLVGTKEFGRAVVDRLQAVPRRLHRSSVVTPRADLTSKSPKKVERPSKALVGVDVFVDDANCTPDALAKQVQGCAADGLLLELITNRGVKVWPDGFSETLCVDHWRCRFIRKEQTSVSHAQIIETLQNLLESKIDFIKTEQLYEFDGKRGYSLAQGQ